MDIKNMNTMLKNHNDIFHIFCNFPETGNDWIKVYETYIQEYALDFMRMARTPKKAFILWVEGDKVMKNHCSFAEVIDKFMSYQKKGYLDVSIDFIPEQNFVI